VDHTARPPVRTAAVWAVLRAELDRRAPDGPLRVLDAGGGSGQFAVPIAELGHVVTVVDASPDALAALDRRANERAVAERVRGLTGDADRLVDLVGPGTQDLVLCHSLLEVVDDPPAVLAGVATVLVAGGTASVLVANRHAAVLARAAAGHPADALAVLADPAGRVPTADRVLRRFDREQIGGLLAAAGLTVQAVHGVRVFADLVPGGLFDADPAAADALRRLELAVADRPPYRDIATQLHLLTRRG